MKKLLTALALALCCMAGSFAYEAYVVGTDLHFDNVKWVEVTTYDCEGYSHDGFAGKDVSQYFMHWQIMLEDGTKWIVEGNAGVATNAPINKGLTPDLKPIDLTKEMKDRKKKSK